MCKKKTNISAEVSRSRTKSFHESHFNIPIPGTCTQCSLFCRRQLVRQRQRDRYWRSHFRLNAPLSPLDIISIRFSFQPRLSWYTQSERPYIKWTTLIATDHDLVGERNENRALYSTRRYFAVYAVSTMGRVCFSEQIPGLVLLPSSRGIKYCSNCIAALCFGHRGERKWRYNREQPCAMTFCLIEILCCWKIPSMYCFFKTLKDTKTRQQGRTNVVSVQSVLDGCRILNNKSMTWPCCDITSTYFYQYLINIYYLSLVVRKRQKKNKTFYHCNITKQSHNINNNSRESCAGSL